MGFQNKRVAQVEFPGSQEVLAEIARLEAMAERLRQMIGPTRPGQSSELTPKSLRRIIQARRTRDHLLGLDLFADPAWDILLEAYLAEIRQVRISVSSLCLASAVPATTGLRWVKKLEQDGWLCRRQDPTDGRRFWMELTTDGSNRLANYFAAISPIFPI
jgi:DNA-binding MarR family transcriptional regulator